MINWKFSGIFCLFAAMLLLRISLDASFYLYMDTELKREGFGIDFSVFNYVLSWIGLLATFFLLPKKNDLVTAVVVQFIWVLMFVPFTTYFAMTNGEFLWFLLFTLFWLFTGGLCRLNFTFKTILPPVDLSSFQLFSISGLVGAAVLGVLILTFGFILNFDLLSVYEIREQNSLREVPTLNYLTNWAGKIILPFIILFSFIKIRPGLNYIALIFSVFLFLFFSITGHKIFLFTIPLLFTSYFFLKWGNFFLLLMLSISSAIFIGLILYLYIDQSTLLSFLVRRSLFLPAQISFHYFDFFQNGPIYLSGSFLRFIFEYPYHTDPSFLISEVYYNKPNMSSNNGIVSDAYMNFGMAGIFIWSSLLVILLKLLDSLISNKDYLILTPLVIVSAKSFVDSAFFTSLLTHGFIIVLIICFFYPHPKKKIKS